MNAERAKAERAIKETMDILQIEVLCRKRSMPEKEEEAVRKILAIWSEKGVFSGLNFAQNKEKELLMYETLAERKMDINEILRVSSFIIEANVSVIAS
jgi:hypothetical protein